MVTNVAGNTAVATPLSMRISARDADGNPLTLWVISQPAHGSAGIGGTIATYRPEPGFTGTDTFTFAAWDGSTNSNLGTATITVR